MAISLASLRRSGDIRAPRILTYATHGVGKTTLGAGMPNPVVLQTEDGLGMIEAPTFGILTSYASVMEAIASLDTEPHEFQTVVLDSVDWLEPLVWQETCARNQWRDIETPGFGKGYLATADVWREVLGSLTYLRDNRNMAIFMIAHAETRRFDAPETEAYDRYQPKLQKIGGAIIQEHVDAVFFLNYRVSIAKDDPKQKDSRARGVGGGSRVLYTTERPAHLAKNRYRMPDQITLPDDPAGMWPAVAKHLPFYSTPTTSNEGVA